MVWKDWIFVYLSDLNDDFDGIRSQILNIDNPCHIEQAQVKAKKNDMLANKGAKSHELYIFRSLPASP